MALPDFLHLSYIKHNLPTHPIVRIMSKQSRQSRWGAPLPSSSSSMQPPVAAGRSLPEEEANNQQKMCDFSKNNSTTAQQRTTSSSSQYYQGQDGDLQHQPHRRGYDMIDNDYYGGTMIYSAFFESHHMKEKVC